MKITVSRLNKTVSFGHTERVENDGSGDYDIVVVPDFKVHCALYNRTFAQDYQLMGTELEDTIVLAVRSDQRINKSLKASFDGNDYDLPDVSKDASGMPVGYDLVTLKLRKKVR
ncbi:phage head closure protein [Furfurilactobacillus sp. WILCCON 0119]